MVLADPRLLADCFPAIEYFEKIPDAPFIVALNCFDGILPYELEDIRTALAIDPAIPLLTCDARDTASAVCTDRTRQVRDRPDRRRGPGLGNVTDNPDRRLASPASSWRTGCFSMAMG